MYFFFFFCATWKPVFLFKVIDVHGQATQNRKEFDAYGKEYAHI